ncbi:MAG TPA: LuxR C-terminal-related transcriptional regulator [Streptosporangiaceae bacterium]
MFDVIGIGAEAEQVYEAMLGGGLASVAELAGATGMPPARVQAAVGVLEANHLAASVPGPAVRYQAADPAVALDVLLLRQEQELKHARNRASELAERYRQAAGRQNPAELVEIISGRQATVERVEQAQRAARHRLRILDKPPYAGEPTALNEIEIGLVGRGGIAQTIYERAAIEIPGRLKDLETGIAGGEQARILPSLPTKLFIIDDALAILPLQALPEAIESSVVVHRSALLEAIMALFETLWQIAIPLQFASTEGGPAEPPHPWEQRILALLTAGLPDDAVARQLGLSQRTYQRRMREIMDRLHAQTRFQLALQAARRGWLDNDGK